MERASVDDRRSPPAIPTGNDTHSEEEDDNYTESQQDITSGRAPPIELILALGLGYAGHPSRDIHSAQDVDTDVHISTTPQTVDAPPTAPTAEEEQNVQPSTTPTSQSGDDSQNLLTVQGTTVDEHPTSSIRPAVQGRSTESAATQGAIQ